MTTATIYHTPQIRCPECGKMTEQKWMFMWNGKFICSKCFDNKERENVFDADK